MVPLLPQHRQHLHESGLTDETISDARIESCIDPRESAGALNWSSGDGPVPAIVLPQFTADGNQAGVILRPDVPRRRPDGREPKYEAPKGISLRPYFPPPGLVDPALFLNASVPLVITEGVKKVLILAQEGRGELAIGPIGLHGVDSLHDVTHRRATGLWRPHPDIARFPLQGRRIYIAFDGGDTTEKPRVIMAEARDARMLLDLGADVRLIRIPFRPGGQKVGIDDFLAGQPDRGAALAALLDSAVPADPIVRARAVIGISDQVRRGAAAANLLRDLSLGAALCVGGSVVVDVLAEVLSPVGVRIGSIREAVSHLEQALSRENEETRGSASEGVVFSPEIEAAAEGLLRDPQLIDRFHRGLAAEGVVGEQDASLALLLIMVTRKTKRPVHCCVKAASASGKNFVALRVAARFPASDMVLLTDLSPRSLLFQKSSMRGKVFIVMEQEGAERSEYTMRVAMSEGSLSVFVAEKSDSGNGSRIETRQHQVDGPACFITTTTRASLHDENETRVLEVTLDESEDQTRRIIRGQADRAAHPPGAEELELQEEERLVWQCAMAKLELVETVNRRAHELLAQFPTRNIRARRDFQRVLDLASASALLHQRQRQVIEGRVVVDELDVRIARELCDGLYATSSPRLQSLADRLRSELGTTEFTVGQAAPRIGYSTDALRRNLEAMEGHDLARKVSESRGSKAARWQMIAPPGPGISDSRCRPVSVPPRSTTATDDASDRTPSTGPNTGIDPSDRPTASGSPFHREGGIPGTGQSQTALPDIPGRTVGRVPLPSDSGAIPPTVRHVDQGRSVVPGAAGELSGPLPRGPILFSDEELGESEP